MSTAELTRQRTLPAEPVAVWQLRRALRFIWLVALLVVGLTVWHVNRLTQEGQKRELASAMRDLANLTRVSQEHANRTFRSADQVIRFVQERYLAQGHQLDLTALTQQGVIDTEIFNQVGIIDAKGIYALANRPVTGKLDLSDREHFKVHVAADSGQMFVSKPVIGRATGKWSIQLTRRINGPRGEFAGVVVISIDPSYFTSFYGELKLGSNGVSAIYGLDGIGRARREGNHEAFGSDASKSTMFERIRSGQKEGTFTSRSVVDGVERLHHYRTIPGYPLVVVLGLNAADIDQNTLPARQALWLQGAIVCVLALALAVALTRHLSKIRHEILARLAAQRQARERAEQLDTIFELSPDGFVSFDMERRVQFTNPAFAGMTALGEHHLTGMDEQDFSAWLAGRCEPKSRFGGVAKLRARVLDGAPDANELIEIQGKSRRTVQIGLRCHQTGGVSQIMYFRDITAEVEIDAMKSEFMSTAAHELRTPMTSVLGFTELLLKTDVSLAEQQEFLQIVFDQSQIMAHILDELLDLARIEARRGKDFRYTRVELQKLVQEIVRAMILPAGREMPELSLPPEPLYVMADASKLQQAIVNVLSNAFKYSGPNGVVRVQLTRKQSAGAPEQVCVLVADGGIGMTAEQQAQVFDRFYRADTSGKFPGTGLGMSIVKEIVELHQGQIHIDSQLGQGTRVTLCLPSHCAEHPAVPIAPLSGESS